MDPRSLFTRDKVLGVDKESNALVKQIYRGDGKCIDEKVAESAAPAPVPDTKISRSAPGAWLIDCPTDVAVNQFLQDGRVLNLWMGQKTIDEWWPDPDDTRLCLAPTLGYVCDSRTVVVSGPASSAAVSKLADLEHKTQERIVARVLAQVVLVILRSPAGRVWKAGTVLDNLVIVRTAEPQTRHFVFPAHTWSVASRRQPVFVRPPNVPATTQAIFECLESVLSQVAALGPVGWNVAQAWLDVVRSARETFGDPHPQAILDLLMASRDEFAQVVERDPDGKRPGLKKAQKENLQIARFAVPAERADFQDLSAASLRAKLKPVRRYLKEQTVASQLLGTILRKATKGVATPYIPEIQRALAAFMFAKSPLLKSAGHWPNLEEETKRLEAALAARQPANPKLTKLSALLRGYSGDPRILDLRAEIDRLLQEDVAVTEVQIASLVAQARFLAQVADYTGMVRGLRMSASSEDETDYFNSIENQLQDPALTGEQFKALQATFDSDRLELAKRARIPPSVEKAFEVELKAAKDALSADPKNPELLERVSHLEFNLDEERERLARLRTRPAAQGPDVVIENVFVPEGALLRNLNLVEKPKKGSAAASKPKRPKSDREKDLEKSQRKLRRDLKEDPENEDLQRELADVTSELKAERDAAKKERQRIAKEAALAEKIAKLPVPIQKLLAERKELETKIAELEKTIGPSPTLGQKLKRRTLQLELKEVNAKYKEEMDAHLEKTSPPVLPPDNGAPPEPTLLRTLLEGGDGGPVIPPPAAAPPAPPSGPIDTLARYFGISEPRLGFETGRPIPPRSERPTLEALWETLPMAVVPLDIRVWHDWQTSIVTATSHGRLDSLAKFPVRIERLAPGPNVALPKLDVVDTSVPLLPSAPTELPPIVFKHKLVPTKALSARYLALYNCFGPQPFEVPMLPNGEAVWPRVPRSFPGYVFQRSRLELVEHFDVQKVRDHVLCRAIWRNDMDGLDGQSLVQRLVEGHAQLTPSPPYPTTQDVGLLDTADNVIVIVSRGLWILRKTEQFGLLKTVLGAWENHVQDDLHTLLYFKSIDQKTHGPNTGRELDSLDALLRRVNQFHLVKAGMHATFYPWEYLLERAQVAIITEKSFSRY